MPVASIRWLIAGCLLLLLGVAHAADVTAAKFDLGKAARALKPQVEEARTAASGATSIDDKKAALEKIAALKEKLQAFSDEATKNGANEEAIGDALERLKIADISKMERDLKAAVNEAGGPKPKE